MRKCCVKNMISDVHRKTADADIGRCRKENKGMIAKLLGTQEVHFTNNNGETINGMNIYTASADENVDGFRTDKFFLKEGITLPKDIKLNDNIDLSFNMKGKVEKVSKA